MEKSKENDKYNDILHRKMVKRSPLGFLRTQSEKKNKQRIKNKGIL